MGYVLAFGFCANCKRTMSFNPRYVPSVVVNGEKQPICKNCIEWANPQRKANGLEEFKLHPQAYEIAREDEVF